MMARIMGIKGSAYKLGVDSTQCSEQLSRYCPHSCYYEARNMPSLSLDPSFLAPVDKVQHDGILAAVDKMLGTVCSNGFPDEY